MEANPRRALTRSLLIGAITVPAIALVAVALSAPPEEQPTTTDQAPVAVAAPAGVRTAATPPSVASNATGRDYRLACGRDGRALIKRQQAGSASQVEEAALAALRPICEAQGKPLPAEPAPEVIIETIATPPAAAVPAAPAGGAAEEDSDGDRDDDWDEDSDDDSHDDRDDDHLDEDDDD
ncbi:MAG TPA: hypothetical protein VHM94_15050 [Acidimicrobiia bacterium]|jgi:hypothetical protein|nr:hypothetical protein [Acidimicrobiia bacterium]